MLRKNYVSKVVPVLKQGDEFIRNPQVITDKWADNGEIVYGEPVTGEKAKEGTSYSVVPPSVSHETELIKTLFELGNAKFRLTWRRIFAY